MTHHHFGHSRLTVSPSAAPHEVRVARVVASVSTESQWPPLSTTERTLHEHGSTLTGSTKRTMDLYRFSHFNKRRQSCTHSLFCKTITHKEVPS